MWLRNIVFVLLVATGLVALAANLFPKAAPPRVEDFQPSRFQDADFQSVVEKFNSAFRRQWAERNLHPAPRASALTIIRRLSLGLTGTIPSLQEIRQFQAYGGPEPIQWWLAGILKDRRYADYLAERLARAYVGTEDGPFILYRRRRFVSWLSDQLMENRPYDEIVRHLIADQGLWTDKPATNFITVTIENNKKPNPERLAGQVSRAFLALRLDCAQCHDHPFEEWKQEQFQALAAFFGGVRQGFTGIYDSNGVYHMEDRRTKKKIVVEPNVPFLPELRPSHGTLREQLAHWVTHRENRYFARAMANRMWALMTGKPLIEPVDNIVADASSYPLLEQLDILAEDFAAHHFDLHRLIQVIAATEAFQRSSCASNGFVDGEYASVLALSPVAPGISSLPWGAMYLTAGELTPAHVQTWAVFPLTPLRPEQMVGGLLQSASLQTIDSESHILVRIATAAGQNEFIKRYGDAGKNELEPQTGTLPQRLLLMNGKLVKEKTEQGIFNASSRIAMLAPDDKKAVETAYLAVLSRLPTAEESALFEKWLAGTKGKQRARTLEDIYWVLINSMEFSLNH
ncbi:MAG: hypothetical protein KatS3mg105_1191 [Gemmatales bacterium]|nr:MAG: hypothetical protein KatS3mg105_1191 [Gemmatales bacterium]